MGLLSKLFGAKAVHVYLHVDGEIAVVGISQSISREDKLNKLMGDIRPDLENIQIPVVDFGADIEEDDNLEKA